jgi:moderate conductance mechanosensitive channel
VENWIEVSTQKFRENWFNVLVAFAVTVILYTVVTLVLKRIFKLARRRHEGREGAERAILFIDDLQRWILLAVTLLTIGAGAVAVLMALGVGREEITATTTRWTRDKGLSILLIVFLAFIARRALRFVVEQFMAIQRRRDGQSREDEVRLKTISDVLMGGGSVVIVVVAVFLVLETVLQSIGTVVASVGVLGLAFGFGAQSLVKDLISGFFILLENQMAIGDSVRINEIWGTVERIGLRTITLRDSEGIAHIIPTGAVVRISNATKGYSLAVVNVGADYAADPDKVLATLRQVAREVRAERRFEKNIHGDLKVSGPESFEDAVIYRVSARTHPTDQWEVMREIRYRICKAFAREGLTLRKSQAYSAPSQE